MQVTLLLLGGFVSFVASFLAKKNYGFDSIIFPSFFLENLWFSVEFCSQFQDRLTRRYKTVKISYSEYEASCSMDWLKSTRLLIHKQRFTHTSKQSLSSIYSRNKNMKAQSGNIHESIHESRFLPQPWNPAWSSAVESARKVRQVSLKRALEWGCVREIPSAEALLVPDDLWPAIGCQIFFVMFILTLHMK